MTRELANNLSLICYLRESPVPDSRSRNSPGCKVLQFQVDRPAGVVLYRGERDGIDSHYMRSIRGLNLELVGLCCTKVTGLGGYPPPAR